MSGKPLLPGGVPPMRPLSGDLPLCLPLRQPGDAGRPAAGAPLSPGERLLSGLLGRSRLLLRPLAALPALAAPLLARRGLALRLRVRVRDLLRPLEALLLALRLPLAERGLLLPRAEE